MNETHLKDRKLIIENLMYDIGMTSESTFGKA